LETLLIEIFRIIINLLTPWNIKDLSYISKRLREVYLLFLFYYIEFQFSETGFNRLKSLLKSNIRNHIISFTYIIPELLKANILDFDYFKSNILIPDNYIEIVKELYNTGSEIDKCPLYIIIYKTIYNI
ncbi:hypothetical protein NA56DRAFT_526002, partial [Hyaloscypha hepaticicola]